MLSLTICSCHFVTHLGIQKPQLPLEGISKYYSENKRKVIKAFNITAHHSGPSLFHSACLCLSLAGRRVSVLSGVSQCRQMRSHYANLPQG